jgi:hypothetical protein
MKADGVGMGLTTRAVLRSLVRLVQEVPMPLSEQARAHRIRVLRHQEKLAAKAEIEGSAESSGQQMTLRLIGKVRGTKTELPSAGRKGARARTARQPGLQGL